jgi:hypothetical protein
MSNPFSAASSPKATAAVGPPPMTGVAAAERGAEKCFGIGCRVCPRLEFVVGIEVYRIGRGAKAAVPALLAAAKTKDRLFRESVIMVLRKIDPIATAKARLD